MKLSGRGTALLAAVTVSALALAGCSSTGGKQTESTSATSAAGAGGSAAAGSAAGGAGGGGQVAPTKRYVIAMITHEQAGDTFWDKIRAGAKAAAAKDNIDLKYSNDPDATKEAGLIQNAVQSKVDGIATTLVTPDALKGAVKQATDAKIPLVGFNSGIDAYKSMGALMYFGSDENLAGATVGDKLTAAGAKHPLCVIQAQGSVALEARCAGVKSKIAATENLDVNGADQNATQTTIQAKLQQDPSIDYVVTLGAPIAMLAIKSISGAKSKAKLVTFDLNAQAAAAIKAGTIQFSVDQQPYLQGYLAVDSLWLYLSNGNDIGGGKPVLTGPSIIDSNNIDAIITYANNNTR